MEFSLGYLHTFLKINFNIKFGKPYRKDYRQNPHYKTIFYMRMYHKFKKYRLKYDQKTEKIIDLKSKKSVLIFSFDEAAFSICWQLHKSLLTNKTSNENGH